MGLQTQANSVNFDMKVLRESDVMSHAFNWEQSVELPVDVFEQNENQQIVEAMITKVALMHNQKNVDHILKDFEEQFSRIDHKSKYFFTIDPDGKYDHPVT